MIVFFEKMDVVEHEQRQKLIRGALYSIKTQKDPTLNLKKIATWIALEDMVGDKEFSFMIALSIPDACMYFTLKENELKFYEEESAKRILNRLRTIYYVFGARCLQLGKKVI